MTPATTRRAFVAGATVSDLASEQGRPEAEVERDLAGGIGVRRPRRLYGIRVEYRVGRRSGRIDLIGLDDAERAAAAEAIWDSPPRDIAMGWSRSPPAVVFACDRTSNKPQPLARALSRNVTSTVTKRDIANRRKGDPQP